MAFKLKHHQQLPGRRQIALAQADSMTVQNTSETHEESGEMLVWASRNRWKFNAFA